jgi:hypothetical protein
MGPSQQGIYSVGVKSNFENQNRMTCPELAHPSVLHLPAATIGRPADFREHPP